MSSLTPKCSRRSPFKSPDRHGIPLPPLDFASPSKEDDEDECEIGSIPTLPLTSAVPRITGATLVDMLSGVYDEFFESLFIIDCRYDYEYQGGHIQGAVNINNPAQLSEAFFDDPLPSATIVFHCEFSHNRGPEMASIFRGFDRELNKSRYPYLYYPHVYILDGGYKRFYAEYPDCCDGGYVPMLDKNHTVNGDLVRSTSQYRENMENLNREMNKSLGELPGQHSHFMSPMAPSMPQSPMPQSPMATKMLNFLASPAFKRSPYHNTD
ncbi:Rhodanese-like domain containing protein [Trichomonas vaginalis G3]|uniref:protein-tyrosine-phosphatase n=1 Tax=Trichomonas vaginalis (strain ATCC PRA-98 / G3) TaxID=412133 RepID=A2E292_TRIV3|nr:positive regulation of cell cycle G2/M phase transition [Trichomonas vaginalis G3]EAY13192.1 Rhodanese-like domain containing protein [Trichomonas vaginalis G3]KAI5488190.1 positive regulation of cell cycle G2/M phase transition [Trichomonas vaginalis G3]|eukprot:XP_001325415.1 Rhodanese-like domain containing protein [Trichomonas vaginalis G3]